MPSPAYESAWKLFRTGDLRAAGAVCDDIDGDPEFRLLRAEILIHRGELNQALSLLSEPTSNAALEARRKMDLGFAECVLAHYAAARQSLDEAHLLAEDASVPLAQVEIRQAYLLFRLGDYRGAEPLYLRALEVARNASDVFLESVALGGIGQLRLHSGEYADAIIWLERSGEAALRAGARRARARALSEIGCCHVRMGDPETGLPLLLEAEAIARETGDAWTQAYCAGDIGNAYAGLQQYERAVDCYERALKLARQLQDPYGAAKWTGNLVDACLKTGRTLSAIRYKKEALDLRAQLQRACREAR